MTGEKGWQEERPSVVHAARMWFWPFGWSMLNRLDRGGNVTFVSFLRESVSVDSAKVWIERSLRSLWRQTRFRNPAREARPPGNCVETPRIHAFARIIV